MRSQRKFVFALTVSMIVVAGAMAGLQWWQIAYRFRLFFVDCHGERGVNHIGDGDFMLIYIVNAILLASTVFGVRAVWYESRGWRLAGLIVGVSNAIGCLALFLMHRTGTLVEYGESIRRSKGGT
jgi:hypothetical protein